MLGFLSAAYSVVDCPTRGDRFPVPETSRDADRVGSTTIALGSVAESAPGEPYRLDRLQAMHLFSRADTLYGGSNEIQRNIIAERVLGMPK